MTTTVKGGIFMPKFHGRVQVELLGEEDKGVLVYYASGHDPTAPSSCSIVLRLVKCSKSRAIFHSAWPFVTRIYGSARRPIAN